MMCSVRTRSSSMLSDLLTNTMGMIHVLCAYTSSQLNGRKINKNRISFEVIRSLFFESHIELMLERQRSFSKVFD